MNIENITQHAAAGFNILGLFFLAGTIFIGFSVFSHTLVNPVSFKYSEIVLVTAAFSLPLACFVIAYGFKKRFHWAWYAALILVLSALAMGIWGIVQLAVSGAILLLFSVSTFLWLLKIRDLYHGLEG